MLWLVGEKITNQFPNVEQRFCFIKAYYVEGPDIE